MLKTLLLQHPAIQLLKYYTAHENQTHKPTQNLYTNIYSRNIYNSPKRKNSLYAHQLMNGSAQEASPHSVCVCVLCVWLSHVWLFVTPWTVGLEGPLPMKFSRQEYWSALLFPTSGDRLNAKIKPESCIGQVDSLPLCHLGICSNVPLSIKMIRQCGCLENILLNERNKSHKKPHILWFYLYEMSRKSKFMKTKSRSVVTTD